MGIMLYHGKFLKGSEPDNGLLRVRIYAGEIPDGKTIKRVISDSEVDFKENEHVVLFLMDDDTSYKKVENTEYYILKGAKQGKFLISDDEAQNSHDSLKLQELFDKINMMNL